MLVVKALPRCANFLLGPSDRLPEMLRDAKSFPPLMSAGDYLIGLLPDDIEKQFTDFLEKRNQAPDVGPNETNEPADSTTPPADVGSSSQAAPSA